MTDDPRHDEIRELLVPYSLGQLDDADAARVDAALAADPMLRGELDELHALNAQLLGALPRHAAPAALKGRVLDAIGAATEADDAHVEEPAPLAPTPIVIARDRRRARRFALPGIAAALAAACVVLGVVATNLHGDLGDTRARLDAIERGSSSPFGTGTEATRVSTSDELRRAHGQLIDVGSAYLLVLENVPGPGAGKSWQVWTADAKGAVRNVGIWHSNDPTQLLVIPHDDVRQVMVSHEPSLDRAIAPSSEPFATVNV